MSDDLVQVLAHPLRDRVLFEYQGEPTSPARVARRLGRPVNLISYHTGMLVRHGCVALVRTERRRGALEHFYRSTVPTWITNDEWAGVPESLRRALVRGTLRRLEEEAREAAVAGGFDGRDAVLVRALFELDDEGIAAVCDVLQHAYHEVERIAEQRAGSHGRRLVELALLSFALDDQDQRRQTGSSASS
jgi:hypothetical protein